MVCGAQLKLGDYVKILPGVHDEAMPSVCREGLIVEILSHDKGLFGEDYDQAMVMFHNGKILKFHKSQIKIYNKLD